MLTDIDEEIMEICANDEKDTISILTDHEWDDYLKQFDLVAILPSTLTYKGKNYITQCDADEWSLSLHDDLFNDPTEEITIDGCIHEWIQLFTSICCKHCGKEKPNDS